MSEAILVTGAAGFIGMHLVAALRAAGRTVVTHGRADGNLVERGPSAAGVTHVVHLAGKSYVPDSWNAPPAFYATNVLGTVNVLEYCRRTGAGVTFVSSYVYGIPKALPIDEGHPLQPLNPYSHSKILAEAVVGYYASQFGVRTTIVRPFNIYGPGQDDRFVVPTIVRQAIDPAVDRIMVRDLRPRRDFLHIADFVSLLVATVSRTEPGIYNAGAGHSTSIAELLDAVASAAGSRKPAVSTGDLRPEEVLDVVADISRAARELGWSPRISFVEGIRSTVEWMRTCVRQPL